MSLKVTSAETVSFPQFNWGITKGEERELPSEKEAHAVILSHPAISEAKTKSTESSKK